MVRTQYENIIAGDLAAYHGVASTGMTEKEMLSLYTQNGWTVPVKQKTAKKEPVAKVDTDDELGEEAEKGVLRARCDELGIKYHHMAGAKKLKELLAKQ